MSKEIPLPAAFSAVAITGATAGAAFAGESTGNFERTGKTTPIAGFVAKSICSFSGQNPERFLTGDAFEPGRTQSWGQIPKADLVHPVRAEGACARASRPAVTS